MYEKKHMKKITYLNNFKYAMDFELISKIYLNDAKFSYIDAKFFRVLELEKSVGKYKLVLKVVKKDLEEKTKSLIKKTKTENDLKNKF